MTTSANPTPVPTDPDVPLSQPSEIWRAIGQLESSAAALLVGQGQLKEGLEKLRQELFEGLEKLGRELSEEHRRDRQELREEYKADLREVNRRVDRVFYAILGIGGALLVPVYVSIFLGG